MNLVPLLLIILAIAFFTGSDALFYLSYALGGLWLLSYVWLRQAPQGLRAERRFPARAFHGEDVDVELVVSNQGRWPILWVHLHESIPLSLHVPNFEQRVVSLLPGEKTTIQYCLSCHRRGYYQLGPLSLRLGDLFDLVPERRASSLVHSFIVYPRVVPLQRLGLPSQLPYGELASQQRIFEDPSRFFGVRDYQPGDSLRNINWKSSARAEQLLVKRFQPAIALNTLVILDLNVEDYSLKARAFAGEIGIVVAASIAGHIVDKRQRVGLAVLGLDAVSQQTGLETVPPLRGREHLMRVLETLARAELGTTAPFVPVLAEASADLGWGSSIVIIAPGGGAHMVDALVELRRRGFHILFVATDPQTPFDTLRGQLEQIGIPAFLVTDDQEMDVWR